jgi:hypothetical protein
MDLAKRQLPEYILRGREAANRVAPNLGAASQSRQRKHGFAYLVESAEKKIKRAKRLLEY